MAQAALADQFSRLTFVYTVTGADRTEAAGHAVARAHGDVAQSARQAARATDVLQQRNAAMMRDYDRTTRAIDANSREMRAANDNANAMSGGLRDVGTNAVGAARSFVNTAVQTLKIAGYLK